MRNNILHYKIGPCRFDCGRYDSLGFLCKRSIDRSMHRDLCDFGFRAMRSCSTTSEAAFTLDEDALRGGATPVRCVNYDYRCLDESGRHINPGADYCPSG